MLEILEKEDTTDSKRQAQYEREAMLADDDKRESLWKEFLNKDTKISHQLTGESMGGFFATLLPYETKEKYWNRFWDVIIEQFNTRGRSYAENIYYCAMPKYKDPQEVINKVEELYAKRDQYDGYWSKEILSDLEFLRRSAKVKLFAISKKNSIV